MEILDTQGNWSWFGWKEQFDQSDSKRVQDRSYRNKWVHGEEGVRRVILESKTKHQQTDLEILNTITDQREKRN